MPMLFKLYYFAMFSVQNVSMKEGYALSAALALGLVTLGRVALYIGTYIYIVIDIYKLYIILYDAVFLH